jgi:hypothetical protein
LAIPLANNPASSSAPKGLHKVTIAWKRNSMRSCFAVEPRKADKLLEEIDQAYEGRHTDRRFVEQLEKNTGR